MRIPFLIVSLAALAACTVETMPVSTSSTPVTAAVPVASMQDAGLNTLVNNFRASQGKGPLSQSASLTQAATAHVQDMLSQGYFSHTGQNGSSVGTRVRAAGCSWSGVAENIAQGQATAQQAMDTWINSSAHRANLVGPYTQFGTARVGNTWVLVFASGC